MPETGASEMDAIICAAMLEHLHDPEALLSHLRGRTNSRGILLVTIPNGYGP